MTMKGCFDIGETHLFRAATGEVSEGESIGTLHRAGRVVGTPAPKEG